MFPFRFSCKSPTVICECIYVMWSDKKGLIAHLPVLRYDGLKFL